MEPLFTFRSELSADDYRDIVKAYIKRTLFSYLSSEVLMVAYAVLCFRKGTTTFKGYSAGFAAIWLAVGMLGSYLYKCFSLKRRMSAHAEKAGRFADYEFFEDYLTVSDETGCTRISNGDVNSVAETQRAFYIFLDGGGYLSVFKSLTPPELHIHIRQIKDAVSSKRVKMDYKKSGLYLLFLVLFCLAVGIISLAAAKFLFGV